MEDKEILTYDDYNTANLAFYFLFFVVTGLMVIFDYEILIHIENLSNFWLVPILWNFCLIPSIMCLVYLHSLYCERNKFYSTEFIVKRKISND